MAKPIVVIYLPDSFSIRGERGGLAMQLMGILNGFADEKYKSSDYWKDYYWFCFTKHGIGAQEFEVFYEKDFTDVKFEELKQIVLTSIEQIKLKTDGNKSQ